MSEVDLTVVLPVYRCAPCLSPLLTRLEETLSSGGLHAEIIMVDDGSDDGAWETIRSFGNRVHGIRLERNRGQPYAIATGLREAKGPLTIVLDADLEDPPEAIPRFLEKKAFDIVFGQRRRPHGTLTRRLLSRLGDLLSSRSRRNFGSYSLLSAKARAMLLSHPCCGQLFISILEDLPLSKSTVEYDQEPRPAGGTSYSLLRLLHLALSRLTLFCKGRLSKENFKSRGTKVKKGRISKPPRATKSVRR